jgi:cytochrome c oxidase cbb3-type subunit I/II
MPKYDWLAEKEVDLEELPAKINAMRTLGVPYEEGFEDKAVDAFMEQANGIAAELKAKGIKVMPNSEMIAIIAYLQRLGGDLNRGLTKEEE